MFKRLLPAVVVVLLGILAATALFVPRSRWSEILSQTWSSLFYFQNWALAANSVDYYATDQSIASPLQHFWSLSVQGQVFILWPLLFALAAVIAKAAKIRIRRAVLLVFGSVFVASLTFSIYETYTNQVHAYFDTRTRLWEFAFGTLLVLALPYLKLPQPVRVAAGWIGLAAMLSGGFILDVQGQFPGYVALWPLVAAALIILAGQTESPFGADRLLTWKPLNRLGDMSYALYLWHWPVLIIYLIWRGREEVGPVGGTAIIGLSLVLAYLTTRFVERPLRSMQWAEKKKRRAAVVMAICVVIVATPVAGWQQILRMESQRAQQEAVRNNPGARVLTAGYEDKSDFGAPVLPLLSDIGKEWGTLDGDCESMEDAPPKELMDPYCMATADEDYDGTILVLGDSHSQQWLGGLEPIAEERDYRVISVTMGACKFGAPSEQRRAECNEFNSTALNYAKKLKPDAVIVVGTDSHPTERNDTVVDGLAEAANELGTSGIPVIAMRDNPRFDFNMISCVEKFGAASDNCRFPLDQKLADAESIAQQFSTMENVTLIDMTDLICPDGLCEPIIGNVRVYMDHNHLGSTYVESMKDELDRRLSDALGW
jgi:peptidoglycan/LPS O-acetylase OafA/YrhL